MTHIREKSNITVTHRRRRYVYIGILLVSLLFVGFSIFILEHLQLRTQLQKCPAVDLTRYGRDLAFVGCYNNIVIDKWWYQDMPAYSLWDIKHKYDAIGFTSFTYYRLFKDTMYVFRLPTEGGSYSIENGKKLYFEDYFVNGELKTFYYKTVDEMPRYFAIDTITGEVRLYRFITEVPQNETAIFQALEKKYRETHY